MTYKKSLAIVADTCSTSTSIPKPDLNHYLSKMKTMNEKIIYEMKSMSDKLNSEMKAMNEHIAAMIAILQDKSDKKI